MIRHIDSFGSFDMVHISVRDLRIRNPLTESGYQDHLSRAPISIEALDASVTAMIAEDASHDADFERGYVRWRDDNGGVFTLTVSEIVSLLERTVAATD